MSDRASEVVHDMDSSLVHSVAIAGAVNRFLSVIITQPRLAFSLIRLCAQNSIFWRESLWLMFTRVEHWTASRKAIWRPYVFPTVGTKCGRIGLT